MRPLVATMWLLTLTACSVNLEGAHCSDDSNCPKDQRCDTATQKCVACVSDPECSEVGRICSGDGTALLRCVRNAGSCLYSIRTECGQEGCSAQRCDCPANTTSDFYADSVSGSQGGLFRSTGVFDPASCRFKTITAALQAAVTSSVVHVVGGTPGSPSVFSKASGETIPLNVPAHVSVVSDDPNVPPLAYLISLDEAAANPGIVLHEGATLSGFRVQSAGTTGDGITFSCGSVPSLIAMQNVDIDGTQQLANAIKVAGSCDVQLTDIRAAGATASALWVDSPSSSIATTITRGRFATSGTGLRLTAGSITLIGPIEVASNAGNGMLVSPNSVPTTVDVLVTASGLDIHSNSASGVKVKDVTVSSTIAISKSVSRQNAGESYGPVPQRQAGGVLLWGGVPASFIFQGNTVCGNQTDQIGVYSSSGTWRLSGSGNGGGCDSTSNTILAAPASYYTIYATSGATVEAAYDWWSNDPPSVVNVGYTPTCGTSTQVCP